MKAWICCAGIAGMLFLPSLASAENKWIANQLKSFQDGGATKVAGIRPSDSKLGQGLKEALQVGITNAVNTTGRPDGYFSNSQIRIILPEQLKTLEKALRAVGYGKQLDQLTLSMNRAAEKAAPSAQKIFVEAIFNLSFEDAQKIYSGGNTAATDYLKKASYAELTKTFTPIVQESLKEYTVTDQYKTLVDKYQSLPLAGNFPAPDIDQYVITKSLDGLFFVLGQEEHRIRTEPQARVTDLLKEVFR